MPFGSSWLPNPRKKYVKLSNYATTNFLWVRACIRYFFLVSKKGIPESFFTLSTHFTQVAAIAFGSVVVARAMCEICHFNEPTLRTECSCMQPFSPPLPTHHATKVLSSGSCTTNQHHPPIYHLTALVVVGAVAWTKLNPASGAWPSEGETLRKSLI